ESAYLPVASQGSAQQLFHGPVQLLFQQLSRCSGGNQFMFSQLLLIKNRPFCQILFFIVVRNKGNPFSFLNQSCFNHLKSLLKISKDIVNSAIIRRNILGRISIISEFLRNISVILQTPEILPLF